MEKLKILFARKPFKILMWVFFVLAVAYVILVAFRVVHFFNIDKTNAQVEKIHATKLTLDDVMGKNLPPDPGAEADKTVPGIDANQNGIRDDVELAVFKEYSNSAKTRAVLLQYALALQMETIQPIVNESVSIAVAQEEDRAYICVGEILLRDDNNDQIMKKYFEDGEKLRLFIEDIQFNTEQRVTAQENFYKKVGSYNSLDRFCDIDYSKLPN